MLNRFLPVSAALGMAILMTACGGAAPDGTPDMLPALVQAQPASLAPASAATSMPAIVAPAAASFVDGSADAPRVIAWEQSYSLEMNRRHAEQQAQENSGPVALEQGNGF